MSKLLEFCSALLLLGAVHHADALVSVAHTLRECPREKSENLGILANLKACKSCPSGKRGKKIRRALLAKELQK
jgi:hypothetical protein